MYKLKLNKNLFQKLTKNEKRRFYGTDELLELF